MYGPGGGGFRSQGRAGGERDGCCGARPKRLEGETPTRDFESPLPRVRQALRGDPPARVEQLRVQLKPGASAVKAKPRRYDPVKTSWLASCVAALLAFELLFRNLQAVGSSPAMAVPKRDSVRLVGDLLSRWVGVSALPVRAVAVCSPCDQDDSMPSKAVVRQAQQKALATDGTELHSFESAVGLAVLDDEGLFRIHGRG